MPNVAPAASIVMTARIALPAIAPLPQHKLRLNEVAHVVARPPLGRWEQEIVLWEWRDGRQCDECGMYYGGRWRYVRHFWQPVPEWSYHDEDE